MPRKTDSNNPADWLFMAESDMEGIQACADNEAGYYMAESKLAEVLEKILKAELLRLGWFLEKTHDLEKLANELNERKSDLISSVKPLVIELAEAYVSERYPGFDLEEPNWVRLRTRISEVRHLLRTVKVRVQEST